MGNAVPDFASAASALRSPQCCVWGTPSRGRANQMARILPAKSAKKKERSRLKWWLVDASFHARPLPHTPSAPSAMAPPKATKTAAEKKPAKKTTKTVAGDKKKKVKRSKARGLLSVLRSFAEMPIPRKCCLPSLPMFAQFNNLQIK